MVPHDGTNRSNLTFPRKFNGLSSESLTNRLKSIKLIIFDVDGVLTDGKIIFAGNDIEIKSFDVKDGHGIRLAMRSGLEIALVTGRTSDVVTRRALDLNIVRLFQGVWDKKPVMEQLVKDLNLEYNEIAVAGDDIVDIPMLRLAGLAVTTPEAPLEVRKEAHYVTVHSGGRGAARELIEMVLKAQNKWDMLTARYYQ
ncbi:MAG: KdsC family phosphatase [Desulfomonilaceae bacterium]